MKNHKNYFVCAMLFRTIFLSGCNLVDSDNNDFVEIQLSSSILTKNDPIIVTIKNNSSERVLIHEDNSSSPLQKKDSDGNWVRLVSYGRNDTDSYTLLEPYKPYTIVITQDYLSGYTKNIRGR